MNSFSFSFLSFWKTLPEESLHKSFWFWAIRFLFNAGSILGMTLLLSYFIAYYHSPKLPLLFLGIAFGTLIGTFLSQFFLKRYSAITILLFISGIIPLFLILNYFLIEYSFLLFFLSIGIIFSIGMIQLNILLSITIEKSFSPLESEEAFPLIESAEPMGGILAGAIAFIFSSCFPPETLILIWAFIIFLSFILLWFQEYEEEHITNILFKSNKNEKNNNNENFSIFKIIERTPLLQTLFIFVFLQSVAFIISELLYSMALSALFSHEILQPQEIIVKELTHGIGAFHITTYGICIIVQIFFAAKIQHSLGLVKTMFIQPFFLFITSLLGLFTGSFWIGLGTKGVYETTWALSKNSYHSTFYSFHSEIRENAKEILEGIARPLGIITASLFLIIISTLAFLYNFNFIGFYIACSFFLALISSAMFFFYRKLQKGYTKLAIQNICEHSNCEEKFDAIEILAQNGHVNTIPLLSKTLRNTITNIHIQKKILNAFGDLQKNEALPDILWALESENKELQLSSVEALNKYKSLQKYLSIQVFSRHKIISVLKKVFLNADSKRLRLAVIQLFKTMKYTSIASFLIESLNSENIDTAFCSILGCSSFKDISIASYISPLLEHKNPFIKSASIIALCKFPRYRKETLHHLKQMIESKDEHMKMSGIYTAGEIKEYSYISIIQNILFTAKDNIHLRKHCLISLIKMGYKEYTHNILQMIFHTDIEISESTKKLLFSPTIEKKLQGHISSFIRKKVIKKIHSLLRKYKNTNISSFPKELLTSLHVLYYLIGNEKMIWKIEQEQEK